MIGLKIQDIVHPQDYSEMARILHSHGQDFEQGQRSYITEPHTSSSVGHVASANV